ncbi:hypothetical protein F4678DRAFT_414398 [Xylaria arbuscula]|nr:hypothetical protein F4678DRAFT_414398 [Xylaria arbuscula]
MQLKRKRSESELSTSTTSTFNSPPRISSFAQSIDMSMDTDGFTFTSPFAVSPRTHFINKNLDFSHVPGRTMKRLRDNRPSEHEVHQRTLDMLYAAQRQSTPQGTSTSNHQQHQTPIAVQPGASSSTTHQSNLHSFWNLPSRPPTLPGACLPPSAADTPTECEDCGQKLCGDDGDMAMDIDDMSGPQAMSCRACGKHVCSHCSITNLGEQRRCLTCAGTESRAGGGSRAAVPWARGMSNWLC